jgi:hypothetical protein
MPFDYYNTIVQNEDNACGAFALAATLDSLGASSRKTSSSICLKESG